MMGCSIGKDKKAFKCTQWEVTQNNSSQADKLAAMQNYALGSVADFEFYDNQIKMTFLRDQIIFNKNADGIYKYERTYNINNRSGTVSISLYPRSEYGSFVTSIDMTFWVDYDKCGEASFSRNW